MSEQGEAGALLRWYLEAGVDAAIGESPVDRYAVPQAREKMQTAQTRETRATQEASTLAALEAALENFDGCALNQPGARLVFGDGNPEADLMIIGEAPGAEEERQGLPFVGPAGKLLDRMLAAIGRDRGQAYITNMLYWRPPLNRSPTPAEITACQPFLLRHIALVSPKLVVAVGGTAAKALLDKSTGIMRLRGNWFELPVPGLAAPLPMTAILHPAFLLRSPGQKRETWRDLLAIAAKLDALGSGG